MAPRPLVVLFVLATAAPPLSGCFGDGGERGADSVAPDVNQTASGGANATLPQDRGQSSGLLETNRTETGVGGVDHTHDYWAGTSQIVLFEGPVYFSSTPVYPDGEGSDPKSVAYVKLRQYPAPMLVYEGAATVEVTARGPAIAPLEFAIPVTHPTPPALKLQYRTAADVDWRAPADLPYDAPFVIDVQPKETDMPHSVSSLWVWRLTTDRPHELEINLTIIAFRGRDVENWPGHPDFYADQKSRVVLDTDVQTRMSGVAEGDLYDSGGTWVHPDKLVSHGTTRLEVFANVTRVDAEVFQQATGFFLEYHNATIIGPEIRFGKRLHDGDGTNDLHAYNFTIEVDAAGMDGPYQPASRWGFRLMATFADVDVPGVGGVGVCPGCFPYEIEYHLAIVAVSDTDQAEEKEPPAA